MSRQNRQVILTLLFLSVLVIILRLPSLEEPFDNDSSAVAYSARLITRGEPLYSTHHPGHHLPAAYYTYALAFELFGDSFFSVKLFLLLWIIATAYLVYFMGRSIFNQRVGGFAAVLFSVLSSHIFLKGTTAEPEMFAMLPFTAAVLLAVRQIQIKASGWQFFWTGVFGAIAFFYKAVFLAPMAVAAGMILLDGWIERNQSKTFSLMVQRFIGLAVGFISVSALVSGYFASHNLLGRFMMVFNSGLGYVNLTGQQSVFNILLMPIYILTINNLFLVVFGFAGVLRMLRINHWQPERNQKVNLPMLGIVIWFMLSLLTAGITRVDYPHYSLIVVPSLSVLAGWELTQLSMLPPKYPGKWQKRYAWAGYVSLLMLTLLNSGLTNFQIYSHYIRYRLNMESYPDFLVNGTFEGYAYIRSQKLATYISEHTSPDDFIYHWTEFPQIYYLTDRRAPIDMIWPTQTKVSGSPLLIFGEQTKYIILGTSIYGPEPQWFDDELEKAYRLEKIIDGQKIYRRMGD